MLLSARDDETGAGMTDRQLRDEVLTMLLAGHETTSLALSWTYYLLSQHPDVEQRIADEVDRVIGGGRPGFAHLERLTCTRRAIEESLRLYPPAWAFSRQALGDDEIGGYRVTRRLAGVSGSVRPPSPAEAVAGSRPLRSGPIHPGTGIG